MATFVINEWLWADLGGLNGKQAQRQSFGLIEKLPLSDHRIVVTEGSPFDQKAWALCKNDKPMIIQRIGGLFVTNIRQDSDHCLVLKLEMAMSIPESLARETKPDDHYLLKAQQAVAGAILVTTDEPLREAVIRSGLPCLVRDVFLSTYF